MIFIILFWAVGIAVGVYGGFKVRQQLGNVSDRSMQNFGDLIQGNQEIGILSQIGIGAVYPFWRLAYALLGQPRPSEKVEEMPELDLQRISRMFRIEIEQTNKPQPVLDAVAAEADRMLDENLRKPETYIFEWKHRYEHAQKYPPLRILGDAFTMFLNSLPKCVENSNLTAPLASVATTKQITTLAFELAREDIFAKTYGRFTNAVAALDEQKEFEKGTIEYNDRLLRVYPNLRKLEVPIALPEEERFRGTWIVAPQGSGKTTLLSALLKNDLDAVANNKACIIIMDGKGDFIEHVRQLKQFAEGEPLAGKLTLIEPSERLALNPLDVGATTGHTIALLEYVFSSLLAAETTAYQSTLLRKVLWAAQTTPYPTLKTVKDILLTGQLPDNVNLNKLHEEDREFFERGQLNQNPYKERRPEIAARIDALTSRVPLLRDMFRAPQTKINVGKLMDTPGVVIIDNSWSKLTHKGSEFFGRFFVALILAAADQRAGRERRDKLPVHVFMDEAHEVIANDPTVATIIQTCRSQNIGMIFAHQELSQINEPAVKSALGNCAIRITNPDRDAKALADDMRVSYEELQGLDKGEFALFIRDYTKRAIRLHVPNDPVSGWPKMRSDELAAIRRKMAEQYHWSPNERPTPPNDPTPSPSHEIKISESSVPTITVVEDDSTPKKWTRH